MIKGLMIHDKDNVIVAIEPINRGEEIAYKRKDNSTGTLTVKEDITIYHKIAVSDIPKGKQITKYGEVIGKATQDIGCGMHVHTHNAASEKD